MTTTTDSRVAQMTAITGEMTDKELAEAFRVMAGRDDRTVAGRVAKSFLQEELERRHSDLRRLADEWSEDVETDDTQDDVVLRYLAASGL